MWTPVIERWSGILARARRDGRPVSPVGAAHPARQAGWAAADHEHAKAAGWPLLPRAHRLPVAASATPSSLSALAHRVRLYARLPARRGVGEHSPPLRGHAARGRWAGGRSHGSHHRHPEREDHGERRPARLGCRQAAEGAQAAHRGGHGRAVARHPRPCGRHSGCRWPRRPAEAPETTLCRLRAVFADSIYNRLAALPPAIWRVWC